MQLISKLSAAVVCALLMGACSSTNTPSVPDDSENSDIFFSFTLTVDNAAFGASRGTWGDDYTGENPAYDGVINTDDVHVAIFDTNGSLLTDVSKLNCFKLSDNVYQYYGEISGTTFESGKQYRCMAVANTGEEPDFENLSSSTFSITSLHGSSASESNFFIPMWGVTTFTAAKSSDTQNAGSINMLRSAVKCRIHLATELQEQGYTLSDVKLNTCNTSGNVVPGGFSAVGTTSAVDFDGCFNPTSSSSSYTQVDFIEDPESTTPGSSFIVYFTEVENTGYKEITFDLTVTQGTGESATSSTHTVSFMDYKTSELYPQLTRNHVYDFEVIGVKYGVNITVSNYGWDLRAYKTFDYDDYGTNSGGISWVEGTYAAINTTNKAITMLRGVTAIGQINLIYPVGATWLASLTASSSDDTTNAILFSIDDSTKLTYTSGTIDGTTKVTLRIVADVDENQMQHKSNLDVYIKYLNGTTAKINEISGWTIIQPI